MKKSIIILLLSTFCASQVLDKSFYMEYLIKVRGHNKGVMQIKHDKNIINVKYFNINKNDKLPFFYNTKKIKYKRNKNSISTNKLVIDKDYSIKYNINKEQADDYNIASIDAKNMSAIYNDSDDEVSANFSKAPLNTIEGLILSYMHKSPSNTKMWLYEPQSNILFSTAIIKKQRVSKSILGKNYPKLLKLTVARVSHDKKQKIPLFYIYKNNDVIVSIESSSKKWEMILGGIGALHKEKKQSIAKWIKQREFNKLEASYSIADIETSSSYERGSYNISFDLSISDKHIVKYEKQYLYQYLQDAPNTGSGVFRGVNEREICSYINSINQGKYSRDCKNSIHIQTKQYSLSVVNKALSQNKRLKYKNCSVKKNEDVISSYRNRLQCVPKNATKPNLVPPDEIGEIIFKEFKNTTSTKYKYISTSKKFEKNEMYLNVAFKSIKKTADNQYASLIDKYAGRALSKKFFNKTRKIQFQKKDNKYGFVVDNNRFRKYICDSKYQGSYNLQWQYRGKCFVYGYSKTYNEDDEQSFITKKFNKEYPLVKLKNETPVQENGKFIFKSLKFPRDITGKF